MCLELGTGKPVWRAAHPGVRTLVVDGSTVFVANADRKKVTLVAFDLRNGRKLWGRSANALPNFLFFFAPLDIFVARGLVWGMAEGLEWNTKPGSGHLLGLDPRTGEVRRRIPLTGAFTTGHHVRCYKGKATEDYLLFNKRGIEFIPLAADAPRVPNSYQWVRGTCRYGILPCNGLIYAPPHACACYPGAKVNGFVALAPARRDQAGGPRSEQSPRLERGPAFGAIANHRSQTANATGWPTYRGNSRRSGCTPAALPSKLAVAWRVKLGTKLSSPIFADGKVLAAAVDQYTLHACDAGDGRALWSYPTSGRIDSPPTVTAGTAIFGCRDGWVYCLNHADAALVWKYRAAPLDRRIIACENLESVWPVHGSGLVLPDAGTGKGRVYAIAGRSIFLDGGLRSLVLDAESGAKTSETVMDEIDPDTGKNVQLGREWLPILPAGLPDILFYSGGSLFMGIQPLNLNGKRERVYVPPSPDRRLWRKGAKTLKKVANMQGVHLFSTIGFLDDSEMHRSAWMYGRDSLGGCWQYPVPTFQYPAANIMSVAGERVYGYGREFYNEGRKATMHLFAMDKNPDLVNASELFKGRKVETRHPIFRVGNATQPRRIWSKKIRTHVRALLVAPSQEAGKPDLLFAVGPPEVIDGYDAIDLIRKQQTQSFEVDRIYEKEKSMAGELGAKLMVVSTANGSVMSETRLDAPAVFDGMSAANGKIFLSDVNGRVICLKPTKARGFPP